MKILLTGGFGYLGSALSKYLNEKNYEVIIASRSLDNRGIWSKNINKKIIDWDSESSIIESIKNIDVIIHAAGLNSTDCQISPKEAFKCNKINTEKIVKLAKMYGIKKFIYISTAHVYKSPLVGYINEDTVLTNSHPYAVSHAEGEISVLKEKSRNFQTFIIRLSNVFGPPVEKNIHCWSLFINSICKSASNDNEININNEYILYRDFISLNLFTKAIEFFIKLNLIPNNAIYNIGSGFSYSTLEIAEIVKDIMNKEYNKIIKINKKANKSLDEKLIYDVGRFRDLGGETKQDIYSSIKETINYCNNNK